LVCQEVEEREEDACWLLNAREAVEWPFAVELQDRFEVGWVSCEARLRRDVLTSVVAFGRAVPEKEAVLEGFANGLAIADCFGVGVWWCRTNRGTVFAAVGFYAVLSSIPYQLHCPRDNILNRRFQRH
jgi:hypothetical protein